MFIKIFPCFSILNLTEICYLNTTEQKNWFSSQNIVSWKSFFFSLFFFIWYLFQHYFCVVVWFGFIHIETCVSLFQIMLLKQKIIISFNYKSLFVRREKIPFLGIIPITWNCLLCMNFLIVTTLKFSFSWEKNLKRKSSI